MQSNDEEHQNGDGRTLQSQFQDLADLQCYISHNYLNLVCYMTNLATCFCVGWMGWGRDVNSDFEYMSNKYQVCCYLIIILTFLLSQVKQLIH